MPDFKCECSDEIVSKSRITIKYIEGEGVVHDIQCDKCNKYMKLANPKTGMPGFGNMYRGQSY